MQTRTVVNNVSWRLTRRDCGLLWSEWCREDDIVLSLDLFQTQWRKDISENEEITPLLMYQRVKFDWAISHREASFSEKLTVEENILAVLEMRQHEQATERKGRSAIGRIQSAKGAEKFGYVAVGWWKKKNRDCEGIGGWTEVCFAWWTLCRCRPDCSGGNSNHYCTAQKCKTSVSDYRSQRRRNFIDYRSRIPDGWRQIIQVRYCSWAYQRSKCKVYLGPELRAAQIEVSYRQFPCKRYTLSPFLSKICILDVRCYGFNQFNPHLVMKKDPPDRAVHEIPAWRAGWAFAEAAKNCKRNWIWPKIWFWFNLNFTNSLRNAFQFPRTKTCSHTSNGSCGRAEHSLAFRNKVVFKVVRYNQCTK